MEPEHCVADACARWQAALGRPRDDSDLTMSRLSMAVNQFAHRGEWGPLRPLFHAAQDFLLTIATVTRNAAMAPGPDMDTELGERLREAYRSTAQAHNAIVDVLQSLDHGRCSLRRGC